MRTHFCVMGKKCKGFIAFLAVFLLSMSTAYANPEGGAVSAGSATISSPTPTDVQIQQTSDKAVIDWRTFNIAPNERTQFVQPSTRAIALNRIDPANGASLILGRLIANGQIWLMNPAGILFGLTARVDTAGLLATTAGISNDDFMAGNYHFTQNPNWNGSVINNGEITVADAGYVALVAPGVENNGTIQANLGTVVLAASREFTVDFYGDQLIQFGVNSELSDAGSTVSNTGVITADGGTVMITAKGVNNIVEHTVNVEGYVQANTAASKSGRIILQSDGRVSVKGTLKANGESPGMTGGKIVVLGKNVILDANSKVLAVGEAGGGDILIGGDYQGKNPSVQNAKTTQLARGAEVSADAVNHGNGGKIIVWSDDETHVYAKLSVRGGANSGNGGLIETSSKNNLYFDAIIDASAPSGIAGTLLLDPKFLEVKTVGGSSYDGSNNLFANNPTLTNILTPASIVTAAASANIILQANTDITFTDALAITTSGRTLTVQAGRDILLNASVSTTNGDITLRANDPSADVSNRNGGGGDITLATGVVVDSGTANMNLEIGNLIGGTPGGITSSGTGRYQSTGIITLISDSVALASGTQLGGSGLGVGSASSVIIRQLTSGTAINLAGGAGGLSLIATELATIRGTNVRIGDTNSGAMTIGSWTPNATFAPGVLTLFAAGITQTSSLNLATSTSDLIVRGTGDVLLDQTSNVFGNIAASKSAGALTIVNATTNPLVITSLTDDQGAVTGITVPANVTITASGSGGTLTVSQSIDTSGGNGIISLSSVGFTQAALTNITSGTGTITINAGGGTMDFTTGTITTTNTGASALTIRAASTVALGNITANTAAGSTVTLGVTSDITGAITQTSGTMIAAGTLTALTTSSINLGNTTNDFGSITTITRGDALTIYDTNALTITGPITTGSTTNAVSITAGGALSINGAITTSGGSSNGISLTGVGLTLAASTTVQAGSGTLSVNAGSGTLTTNAASLFLTTGPVNLTGDQMVLNTAGAAQIGGSSFGSGTATRAIILQSTSGTTMNIAGGASGTLDLTQAELNTIRATDVRMGDTNTGAIAIGSWTPNATFAPGVLTLFGNGITQTSAIDFTTSTSDLVVRGTGTVTLSQANIFSNIAVSKTTGALTIVNAVTKPLTITSLTDDLGTVTGITSPGGVTVTASGALGTLSVNQGVSATDSAVSLSGIGLTVAGSKTINSGSGTLTINAGSGTLTTNLGSLLLSTGQINLTADAMALDTDSTSQIGGSALSTGSATRAIIAQSTNATTIKLAGGSAGTLDLTESELNTIRATDVRIGDTNTGAMTIGSWTPNATFAPGVLTLFSAGITQGSSTINLATSTSDLILRGTGAVTLDQANVFGNIAASKSAGALTIVNAATNPLDITSLTDDQGTVTGITVPAAVTITASGSGGTLTVNQNVDTSGGNGVIALTGAGFTQAASTTISSGTGTITINGGGGAMNFNTGSITTTNATSAALSLQNATTVALGNITANSGTVVLGAGDISGAVTQTALTTLSANNLTANTTNSINLNRTTNSITNLGSVTRGGAFTLVDGAALTINGPITGGTLTNAVAITSSGLLTISGNISTSGANDISLTGVGVTQTTGTVDGGAGTVTVDGGAGAMNFNTGLITTTNATSSAVTIQNATTVALGNITANSGTVVLGAGDISGAVTQTALTTLSANNLTANTTNSINLNRTTNSITNLGSVTRGGAFTLVDSAALTINGPITGGTLTNAVAITSSGLLTISGNISTSGANNISLTGVGVTQTTGTVDGGAGTVTVDGGAGAMNFNTGLITTTNATSSAVTIQNGTTVALGNITANSGTVVLGAGDISGAVTQTALTTLSANNLIANTTSSINLNRTTNSISNLGSVTRGGAFTLVDGAALTINGPVTGGTLTNAVAITSSGLLTISGNISTSGTNNIALTGVGITQTTGTVDGGAGTVTIDGGAGAMNFNTGTITTTNATSSAVTIQNGTTVALGNITANSGTVVLGAGDISGAVTQSALTTLSANNLTANTTSSINLNRTTNSITNLGSVTRGGAFTLVNGAALTINGPITGGTLTNAVAITSSGLLTISGNISTSGANNISLTGVGVTQTTGTVDGGAGTVTMDGGAGAMNFNTGTITTTNATSSAVTIQNGTTVALGNITANSGTIALGAGDISGAVTQTALTTLSANNLTANTTSSINLNRTTNSIANLGSVTRGGAFTLVDGSALTINGPVTGGTLTNAVSITSSGLLTIAGDISTSGANNISLTGVGISQSAGTVAASTGNITINSGAGAISQSGSAVMSGGVLTATSVGGMALGNSNILTGFNATNTGSGNINFNDAVSVTITGISQSGGGTVTLSDAGTLGVSDGATVNSGNAALSITATDLNLNSTGALNSGTADTTITQNTTGGSIGLGGTAGTMSISGSELQQITAENLMLVAPTNGQIIVNGMSAANSANIADRVTLTATAGTTGSVLFQTSASTFKALTATADGITVGTDVTASASDLTLNGGVTLSASSSLAGSGIVIGGTVDGAYNLTLNSGASNTSISDAVGGSAAIGTGVGAAITINSTGTTSFSGAVTTNSGITASSPVVFYNAVTLGNGNTGSTFNSLVTLTNATGYLFSGYDGLSFNAGLTTAGGSMTLASNNSLLSMTELTMGNTVTLKSGSGLMNVTGAISGSGKTLVLQDNTAASTGTVTLGGNVTLGGLTTYGSAANYDLIFQGSSNTFASGVTFNNHSVTLYDGGTAFDFGGALTFTQSGNLYGSTITANGISFGSSSSDQWNLIGAATLYANNNAITFNAKLDGTQNLYLYPGASSDVIFNAPAGSVASLGNLFMGAIRNFTNNSTISALSYTQAGGTLSAFGNSSLHTLNNTTIAATNTIGNVYVGSLTLNTSFANLYGTVDGLSSIAGAQKIVLVHPILPRTHFFNDIDLAGSNVNPANEVPFFSPFDWMYVDSIYLSVLSFSPDFAVPDLMTPVNCKNKGGYILFCLDVDKL